MKIFFHFLQYYYALIQTKFVFKTWQLQNYVKTMTMIVFVNKSYFLLNQIDSIDSKADI